MGKMGSFSASDLKKFQGRLNRLQEKEADVFMEACVKELAARLLTKVIERTPVGDYSIEKEVTAKRDSKNHKKGDVYKEKVNPTGKKGGTLRRGWIAPSHEEAESGKGRPAHEDILEFANGLKISRLGDTLKIEIVNPVEYASYVEYGHRQTPGRYVPVLGKKLKKGWIPGKLMMTASMKEIQEIAPKVLEAKLKKFLGECMG